MKKLLAMLLAALMVLSLSAVAFANSPTQETEPAPAVVTPGAGTATTEDKEDEELTEEEKAAVEDEAEVAKTLEDATVETEDGEVAVAALGKLDEANATDEMKADFEELLDELVKAKAALAEDEAGILAEVFADVEGAAAGQPFRAVASDYPATITIAVEKPEDFVGMMIFVNGKWVKLNCTDNGDGTVTFVLDNPAVICLVSTLVEAP